MRRTRLSTMPLSVLLPKLGEISALPAFEESAEERLVLIRGAVDEGSQEDIRRGVGEEAMLFQVLQWLQQGSNGEES